MMHNMMPRFVGLMNWIGQGRNLAALDPAVLPVEGEEDLRFVRIAASVGALSAAVTGTTATPTQAAANTSFGTDAPSPRALQRMAASLPWGVTSLASVVEVTLSAMCGSGSTCWALRSTTSLTCSLATPTASHSVVLYSIAPTAGYVRHTNTHFVACKQPLTIR